MKTLLSISAILLLAGCTSLPDGVRMSDEERAACAAAGCSVWTDAELTELVTRFYRQGLARGAQGNGRAL